MVWLEIPKSQLSKTFFGLIKYKRSYEQKHVCMYFEPLINCCKISGRKRKLFSYSEELKPYLENFIICSKSELFTTYNHFYQLTHKYP